MKYLHFLSRIRIVRILFFFVLTGCTENLLSPGGATSTSPKLILSSFNGIGTGTGNNYNLDQQQDKVVPFDYYSTGKANQLLCYRPGTGICWIMNNTAPVTSAPVYVPVYKTSAGIGPAGDNYDLSNAPSFTQADSLKSGVTNYGDQIVPYDYSGTGKLDHLLIYRPGEKIIWIMKNVNGVFSSVLKSWSGLGTVAGDNYNLDKSTDVVIPYDYFGVGVAKQLLLYRPGSGIVWIMDNQGTDAAPNYRSVFKSFNGIGGYNLLTGSTGIIRGDQLIPYDLEGNGKLDDLIAYRHASKIFWVLQNNHNQTWTAVDQSATGAGGYNLDKPQDLITPYDYTGNGHADHLIFYRPGSKICWIQQYLSGNSFSVQLQSTTGIGPYDLSTGPSTGGVGNTQGDQIFAFDFNGTGKLDHLACYRPGNKIFFILTHTAGANNFTQIY